MRPAERPPRPRQLDAVSGGRVEVRGRLPWSSNATFLVDVCTQDGSVAAVYKPLRGERPLWDYPPGLYRREVAAYLVSEWLGWGLVPETVARDDGPLGPGSVQRFVEADFDEHYFTLLERPEHHDALRAICAFDLLINNGDRKGGHFLLDGGRRIWAVDHGLCLHAEPKLRTVSWDFAGQPIPTDRVDDVTRVAQGDGVPPALADLIAPGELDALRARAEAIVEHPVFPSARSARAFPWPLI